MQASLGIVISDWKGRWDKKTETPESLPPYLHLHIEKQTAQAYQKASDNNEQLSKGRFHYLSFENEL